MNIYNDPEYFDLCIFYEVDFGGSYEFEKLVIWKKKDGTLLLGTDSGCSCPMPFDDIGIPDLEPATPTGVREWFESMRHCSEYKVGQQEHCLTLMKNHYDSYPELGLEI